MPPIVYDKDQILENVAEFRQFVEPRISHGYNNDMFYSASPTVDFGVEGTFSVIAGRGGVIQYLSGAVAGNRARLNGDPTQLGIDTGKSFKLMMRAATNQTAQCRHFYGVFSALPTAANPPVEPADGIYFRRSDAGGAVNWFAVARTASVETAVDTGVLGDVNMHDFVIFKSGSVVFFFIDGVLKATISTNVPASAQFEGLVWVTLEAVAKSDKLDTIIVYNAR